jgi:dipeptidyl aminopeptidase/acylaminoacyl peptidase
MHGSADKAVPVNQTRDVVASLEKMHRDVRYVEYKGEGHGWRQSGNIKDALETELSWYREKVLGRSLSTSPIPST